MGFMRAERPVLRIEAGGARVLAVFCKLPPTLIGMRRCVAVTLLGAGVAAKLGHRVKLWRAHVVYVKRTRRGRDAEGLLRVDEPATMRSYR